MNINKLRLKDRKKYLIVNPDNSDNDFLDYVANQLACGTDIIELKCVIATPQKILEYGKTIRELCSIYNALFLIHDRADIAQLLEADGIVTDKNGIPSEKLRELTGSIKIIGYNIKSKDEEIPRLSDIDFIISDDIKTIEEKDIPFYTPDNDLKNTTEATFYKRKRQF